LYWVVDRRSVAKTVASIDRLGRDDTHDLAVVEDAKIASDVPDETAESKSLQSPRLFTGRSHFMKRGIDPLPIMSGRRLGVARTTLRDAQRAKIEVEGGARCEVSHVYGVPWRRSQRLRPLPAEGNSGWQGERTEKHPFTVVYTGKARGEVGRQYLMQRASLVEFGVIRNTGHVTPKVVPRRELHSEIRGKMVIALIRA